MSFDVMTGEWWMLYLTENHAKMFQSYDLLERYLIDAFCNLETIVVKTIKILHFRTLSVGKFEVIEQGDRMWKRISLKLLHKLEAEEG